MASIFAVPTNLEGKTLAQIRNEGNLNFRPDVLAGFMGIDENTPLKSGQIVDLPENYIQSSEADFLKSSFKETTRESLYAEELIKTQQKQIDEETKWVNQYLKDNPLAFDEALARKSSQAEYQPFYSELLQDYLKDVNLKKATVQDEQKLLRNLRQLDVGARSRSYQYAVENAQKGWEGKGLFSSGMRARDVGKEGIEYKTGMEGATARYETGEAGLGREVTGLEEAEYQKRRDIFGGEEPLGGIAELGPRQGQYQTALEGGILQRKTEAEKQYYTPLSMAYQRRFPSSQNVLGGYLPPEYLRY